MEAEKRKENKLLEVKEYWLSEVQFEIKVVQQKGVKCSIVEGRYCNGA